MQHSADVLIAVGVAVVSVSKAGSMIMAPMVMQDRRMDLVALEDSVGPLVVATEVGQVGQVVLALQEADTVAAATAAISSVKGLVGMMIAIQNGHGIRHAFFTFFIATHSSSGPKEVERTRTSLWFVCKYPCWASSLPVLVLVPRPPYFRA